LRPEDLPPKQREAYERVTAFLGENPGYSKRKACMLCSVSYENYQVARAKVEKKAQDEEAFAFTEGDKIRADEAIVTGVRRKPDFEASIDEEPATGTDDDEADEQVVVAPQDEALLEVMTRLRLLPSDEALRVARAAVVMLEGA
jgi:hypothetical protein